jgi:hypothetical protein
MILTIEKIRESIGTGELINIIYHGGSEPGTARMILPIKIEDDKVRARCYTSNQVKVFSIEKIELAPDDLSDYTGEHKEPASLEDAIAPYLDELKADGWVIELTSDSAQLFTYYKNGKIRKTASVGIYFSSDSGYAANPRPWYAGGQAYKYLSKAILVFMASAREAKGTIIFPSE